MHMKKMIVMSLLLGASSWSMAAKPAELLKGHNMVHAPTATNASVQKVSQTVKNTANNAVQAAQNTASSVKNTATTNIKNAATTVKNNATQAVQNATTQATTATTATNNNNNVVKNDAAVITQEALRKVEEMAKKTANLERQLEETQKRNAALQQQLAEISKTSVAPTIAVAQQIPPSVQQIQKDVDKKVNNATKKISDASKKATDAVKKSANDATQKIQQATTTTTTSVDVTKLNTLTPSQKMDYLKQVQQTYRNLLQTQNQDISDINRLQQKLLSAQKKLEEAKLQVDKLNAELMLSQDIQADQYRKLQSAGAELNQAWKAVYGESSTPPRLSNNDTSKKI